MRVESHDDHFVSTTRDETWIPDVARRGWVALTRDLQIRRRPNERDAVSESGLRLIVLASKLPFPELARLVAASRGTIERFIARQSAGPWIARFHPPSPHELATKLNARGRVELLEIRGRRSS